MTDLWWFDLRWRKKIDCVCVVSEGVCVKENFVLLQVINHTLNDQAVNNFIAKASSAVLKQESCDFFKH